MKTLTKKQSELATMYRCSNGHIFVTIEQVCLCGCMADIEIVSDELPF